MAGIGFELRKLMRRDSFWGLLRAYGYAGLISSGPWVLSILGVMGIGTMLFMKKFTAASRERTVKKYEARQARQRSEFGRSASNRTAAAVTERE